MKEIWEMEWSDILGLGWSILGSLACAASAAQLGALLCAVSLHSAGRASPRH